MDIVSALLIFIIFTTACWYIFKPFLLNYIPLPKGGSTKESLSLRKKVIYDQIKECEMDYEIGNLTEEDFNLTRNNLKNEVAEIMKKMRANF